MEQAHTEPAARLPRRVHVAEQAHRSGEKRHVLVVPSWYPSEDAPISGIFFREQVAALRDAGYRVGVAVPRRYSARLLRRRTGKWRSHADCNDDDGVPTCRWRINVGFRFVPWQLRRAIFIRACEAFFRRYQRVHGRPDLIHAHALLWGGIVGAELKARFGIPLVVTEHSTAYAQNLVSARDLAAARRAWDAADARLVVSPALGRVLENSFGTAEGSWRWVPNLLAAPFVSADIMIDRSKADEEFTFFTLGILTEKKGHRDLLQAFARSFAGRTEVRLRIGGDGPLRAELERLAFALRIDDQVEFLGMLDRDQVARYMADSDAFVLSSHHETFGVVLIEALACGLPLIATQSGGPEYIVRPGENGLLVPPHSVDALAGAMITLYQTRGQYDSVSLREGALARFGPEAIMTQLSAIYTEVQEAASASGSLHTYHA